MRAAILQVRTVARRAWGRHPASLSRPSLLLSLHHPPLWSPVSRAVDTTSVRCFSERKRFEDEHHLARSLSKFDIPVATQKKWAHKMNKKIRPWTTRPLELLPSPNYEITGLENIHQLSRSTNVLLEVRDVRLPASTHNPSFTRLAKHRMHLICYTHADMIDSPTRDRVEDWTTRSWPEARSIFVDTREHRGDLHFELLYDSLMQNIESAGGTNAALTVGVANTGKSSLLLCILRTAKARGLIPKKTKASQTVKRKKGKKRRMVKAGSPGIKNKPGETREITEYMVREKPRVFFLDVPGMTPAPFVFRDRPQDWFGFAAANLLLVSADMANDINTQIKVCDYVLTCMNRDACFGYVIKLGLSEPTDDIMKVLAHVARGREGASENTLQLRRCKNFLKLFNTGNFGSVVLDDIRKPYKRFVFEDRHFKKRKDGTGYNRHKNKKSNDFDDEDVDSDDDDSDDEGDDFYADVRRERS